MKSQPLLARSRARLLASCLWAAVATSTFAADAPSPELRVWATTADRRYALTELPADAAESAAANKTVVPDIADTAEIPIAIDPAQRRQRIEGFGASITDSSAWLLQRKMRPAARKALLRELFAAPPDGIGLGMVRLTIGASDFSLNHYSLDDAAAGGTDPQLKRFALPAQQRDVLATTRAARAINPNLRVMASPWSAPAWMKDSGSLIKGTLRAEHYDSFARYLTKYVETLSARGVPLFALTLQNEPSYEPENYPGMRLSGQQRIALIGTHLGPMLRAAGHEVRILDWDHNWDKPEEPTAVLSDPTASRYVDGVAWHCYGGHVSAQSKVRDLFPDKSVYLTECSGGDWEPVRSGGMTLLARDLIVGGARHWASGVLLWNLALDETSGPHAGGCGNCRGVVTIDSRSGAVTRNDEYYVLAHVSRFVPPGAYRVASSEGRDGVDNVAFVDPVGERTILLVVNASERPRTVALEAPGLRTRYALAPKSLHTFVWRDGGGSAEIAGVAKRGKNDEL